MFNDLPTGAEVAMLRSTADRISRGRTLEQLRSAIRTQPEARNQKRQFPFRGGLEGRAVARLPLSFVRKAKSARLLWSYIWS
ncbi:protein of unknown function (plasmid) [Cupriavidus neocaledonicus]|uniref:Uncharacterized protein n=1 Tax=Cupriavidus neocaledonicus TaxID=1040979 RepID=A0A375HW79_9BURK|nr:hypothetical protein CBM2605_B40070 [Cupriavidus neocaledonicus]SPD60930.1 protein of unknown function [Cupriavidus neocaledonicus]